MAIDLKKENYNNDEERFTGAPDDGGIYPQREIYPDRNNNINAALQNDPQPQPNIRTAEETAVRVPNYNTAAVPNAGAQKKHRSLILFILGGVFMLIIFAIGAVIGIVSEVMSDEGHTTEYVYQEPDTDFVYSGENMDNIVIDADNISLDVRYGSGSDVTFTVISDRTVTFDEELKNSTLTACYISDEYYDENYYYRDDVILTLPEGFDGQLRLTGRNSDIYCGSAATGTTMDLSCADGGISLYNVAAADIKLNSDNGTISADTVTADSFIAHTDNGSMYLSEVSIEGAADISTENGHMDLEDVYFGGETVINGNGDIVGSCLKFIGDAFITCSNSDIQFSDTEFGNMTISNGNGDVYIETPRSRSEYTIEASTSNGDCLVESGGSGPYKLEIKDRNGNVDVTFFGDSE